MTDARINTQDAFLTRYGAVFDHLFFFDADGLCRMREQVGWVERRYEDMPFRAWVNDPAAFEDFISFIATPVNAFVFVEVSTVEQFTLSMVTPLDRQAIESALASSPLPHFDVACFDETGQWSALFDNLEDVLIVYTNKSK
jgi:hypothetical protein